MKPGLVIIVALFISVASIEVGCTIKEPVFMILGQSAAAAACLAIDKKVAVQDLAYEELKKGLL